MRSLPNTEFYLEEQLHQVDNYDGLEGLFIDRLEQDEEITAKFVNEQISRLPLPNTSCNRFTSTLEKKMRRILDLRFTL